MKLPVVKEIDKSINKSGTDAFAEHTSQELVHALSIRVRVAMPDRAQSLQNMLSIRIRN